MLCVAGRGCLCPVILCTSNGCSTKRWPQRPLPPTHALLVQIRFLHAQGNLLACSTCWGKDCWDRQKPCPHVLRTGLKGTLL